MSNLTVGVIPPIPTVPVRTPGCEIATPTILVRTSTVSAVPMDLDTSDPDDSRMVIAMPRRRGEWRGRCGRWHVWCDGGWHGPKVTFDTKWDKAFESELAEVDELEKTLEFEQSERSKMVELKATLDSERIKVSQLKGALKYMFDKSDKLKATLDSERGKVLKLEADLKLESAKLHELEETLGYCG